MRLAAATALTLAAVGAAPAAATAEETVARADLAAGPLLAGHSVAWGERTPSGAQRLLTGRPGARPVVRHTWRTATARLTAHVLSDLAVDGPRGAVIVKTCTSHEGSPLLLPCAPRAFTGRLSHLRGTLLERAPRRCPRRARNAEDVAAGGGWIAVVLTPFCQSGAIESALGTRIVARKGARRRTIPVSTAIGLQIAGRHLAWLDGNGGAVLYDLERGRRVRAVSDAAGYIMALDVQADGTLAFVRSPGNTENNCVVVLPLDADREQQLECHGATAVAIAAGRVLYDRFSGFELVLAAPGAEPAVLARFDPRNVRAGEIDLGPSEATWAVQAQRFPARPDGMPAGPEPVGRARVVLQRLG